MIPIDRVADQKPYYSGKHQHHGVNVQVIADAAGRFVWTSLGAARYGPRPDHSPNPSHHRGADQDRRDDFRRHEGYQGAHGSVRTPFNRRRFRPKLSRRQKAVNRAHAKVRAGGERAIATLKSWKILVKLRCCPRRATAIVQAILVLHHVEANRHAG
ncbi:transposase family protein [Micromonospora aurantiaca (nom. illeg.)]|uniref:transposase family protein n=1 Tax=Micromonospora aurantiaca (nom. illeg.) TaxID=47850 RepID=UPI0037B894C0